MKRTSLTLALSLTTTLAWADAPVVVADIAPVHSLVSQVMSGIGEPELLVSGSTSPHDFALRPSQARSISNADLIVWIGPNLTPQIARSIENLSGGEKSLTLLDADGTLTHEYREGPIFDHAGHGDGHDHAEDKHGDDHAEHKHGDDHAEHKHGDDHAEHKHGDDHAEHKHGDDHAEHGHEGHDHDGVDPHAWLDPENGKLWLSVIAEELAKIDPNNAKRYRGNATAGQGAIDAAVELGRTKLAPVDDETFLVFHDAYHYFEHRMGVEAAGAISIGDARTPGAARLQEIQEHLEETNASCIFYEPQFNPKLAEAISEGTGARLAVIDPLGSTIPNGPGAYSMLIAQMANSLAACLVGPS